MQMNQKLLNYFRQIAVNERCSTERHRAEHTSINMTPLLVPITEADVQLFPGLGRFAYVNLLTREIKEI